MEAGDAEGGYTLRTPSPPQTSYKVFEILKKGLWNR